MRLKPHLHVFLHHLLWWYAVMCIVLGCVNQDLDSLDGAMVGLL